ncbi:protein spinster-like [Palaemon carinicauda]|uniref:protein spinster-like n=1 Tax=Palaemon carinicauda TaxID=392227 RepID=UPI0035B68B7F
MEAKVSRKRYVAVGLICFINLINYMDRYTVAAILTDIQASFGIGEAEAGLLQTAFIFAYMIMAPLFGWLGDRYNRKWLLAVGILFWSIATLLGSFMQDYGSFLALRCVVGVGEASYTTIAPTIISDYFVGDERSTMLAIFNFAIPVGAGMGYILGTLVLNGIGYGMSEDERLEAQVWRWGLRITPGMGVIAVVLIIFLLDEPTRGVSEGGENIETTSLLDDMKSLVKNKAFILNTLGFTAVSFVMGALAWWSPNFIGLGVDVQESSNVPKEYVPILFGAESMISGLIGVPLGAYLGRKLRGRYPKADPLVCGIGILVAAPLLIMATFVANQNTLLALILCFLGLIFQNLNWSVVTDMMLYTVIPTRRASASALLILVSHTFGDAGSPYIMGLMADAFALVIPPDNTTITTTTEMSPTSMLPDTSTLLTVSSTSTLPPDDGTDTYVKFKSLQYSMAIVTSVDFLGTIAFLWLALYIVKAKNRVDDIIKGSQEDEVKEEVKGQVNAGYDPGPNDNSTSEQKTNKEDDTDTECHKL